MTAKPKIAILWLGACGGCDQAIIDLNEQLLAVAEQAEIMLWPIAMDHKYDRIRALPDGELALSILHGNLRTTEHVELAWLLRRKSRIVLGFGACAVLGGVTGLANLCRKKDILTSVYRDAITVVNPAGTEPASATTISKTTLTLPLLLDHIYTLDQVIPVDGYLPGCPPPTDLVSKTIFAALEGRLPLDPMSSLPEKALCDSCPRNRFKPDRMEIVAVHRIHEMNIDADDCFLAKGIICLGPATRSGCGGSCLAINTPCRGCFGPLAGVTDGGSRFLSALGTLVSGESDEEISILVEQLRDPVGYCYRFTQPTSILGTKTVSHQEEEP